MTSEMSQEDLFSQYFSQPRNGEIAIFCGAGISVNSGIPQVMGNYGIIPYVLKKLGLRSQRHIDAFESKRLPFELIFETLISFNQGYAKRHLLKIFDNALLGVEPNITHLEIARLALTGRVSTVFTTNFDTLLESAFDLLIASQFKGLSYKVYNTYSNNSEQSFDHINWSGHEIRIIKIHGCITRPRELIVTISQISKRRLQRSRQRVVEEFFSHQSHHNKVVVLGYSASDEFDIIPYIKNIQNRVNKSILYVNHNSPSWNIPDEIQSLQNMNNVRNSLSYENSIKRKLKALSENSNEFKLLDNQLKPHNPFIEISIDSWWWLTDTDSLIGRLANNQENEKPSSFNITWQTYVNEWASNIIFKSQLLAELFDLTSEVKVSYSFYKKLQLQGEKLNDKKAISASFRGQGGYFYLTGNYQKALAMHMLAQKCRIKSIDKYWQLRLADSHNNIANCYWKIGDSKKNLYHLRMAERVYKNLKDSSGQAAVFTNLSTYFSNSGNYAKAIQLNNQAIAIYKRNGVLRSVALVLGNQSGYYIVLKDFTKAKSQISEGLSIYEKLNDSHGLIHLLLGKASLLDVQGNSEESESIVRKALALSLQFKYWDQLQTCYLQLAYLLIKKNELDLCQRAIEDGKGINSRIFKNKTKSHFLVLEAQIAEKRGNLKEALIARNKWIGIQKKQRAFSVLAEAYLSSSDLLFRIDKRSEGKDYLYTAYSLYKRLRLKNYEGECEKKLGDYYFDETKYHKADRFYKKALRHYSLTSDQQGIAQVKLSLGILYKDLRKYSKSVDFLTTAREYFETTNNEHELARTLSVLGVNYINLEDHLRAKSILEKAFMLHQALGNHSALGYVKNNLSLLLPNDNENQEQKIQLLEEARSYFQKSKCIDGLALVSGNLGFNYFKLNQLENALVEYEQADTYYKTLNNKLGVSNNLSNIGDLYEKIGNYKEAIAYYNRALPSLKHKKDEIVYAGVQYKKARAYLELRNYKRSEKLLIQALGIYQSKGFLTEKAYVLQYLIITKLNLFGPSQTIAPLKECLSIFESSKNYLKVALTSWAIGNTKMQLREYNESLDWFRKSSEYYKKAKNSVGYGLSINAIGALLHQIGDHRNALKYYKRSKKLLAHGHNHVFIVSNLINGGNIYSALGKYHYAIQNFDDAERISQEHNLIHEVAAIWHNKAIIKEKKGEYTEAIRLFSKASKLLTLTDLLNNHHELIYCYTSIGDYDKAFSQIEKADLLCQKLKLKNELARVFVKKAWVLGLKNNYAEASRFYRKSLTIFKHAGDHENAVYAITGYTQLAIDNKKFRRVLEIVETYVSEYPFDEFGNFSLLRRKAYAFLYLRKYTLALDVLHEALAIAFKMNSLDRTTEIEYQAAEVRFYLKDYHLAIEGFDKALNQNPKYWKSTQNKEVLKEIKRLKKLSETNILA